MNLAIVRIPSTVRFFALGVTTTLLAVGLIGGYLRLQPGVLKQADVLAAGHKSGDRQAEWSGPGGEIEAVELPLGNPEGVFPDQRERLQKPAWFFAHFSEDQLKRFLLSCDLNAIQRQVLLDKQIWRIETNGIVITPPPTLVWFMKSTTRRSIYAALARSPANFAQCYPFRFLPGTFDDFLAQTGLSEPSIEKIQRLAYTSSGVACFTDLEAAHAALGADEFETLVEALYQTPALSLRLRVTPESDIDALVSYWGRGGREKLIKPLLKALAKVPGGASINISFLLPPFARNRLYTYPASWNSPAAEREDCFFTAMNFFNEAPDTNYLNETYTKQVLDTDFERVTGRPTYGDLVAVRGPSGAVVHVCVYLAKNYVFTKNGVDRAQPWVLMRMTDMLTLYRASAAPGQLTFFRRKSVA